MPIIMERVAPIYVDHVSISSVITHARKLVISCVYRDGKEIIARNVSKKQKKKTSIANSTGFYEYIINAKLGLAHLTIA